MAKLIIPGTLVGLNEYINAERRNKYAAATMKKQTEHTISIAIKKCLRNAKFNVVRMNYTWVEPNRRRDKDNIAFAKKFIQDALVKCGVLKGDGWQYIDGFTDTFKVDKGNPQVIVEIEEYIPFTEVTP